MHQTLAQKKQSRPRKGSGPAPSDSVKTKPLNIDTQAPRFALDGAISVLESKKKRGRPAKADATPKAQTGGYQLMPLAIIGRSPFNREDFNQTQLDELTADVKIRGILMPLLVRKNPRYKLDADGDKHFAISTETEGARVRTGLTQSQAAILLEELNLAQYEIIAGERRWMAGRAAKLTEAPVIIREAGDIQTIEDQAVENLQREDLNPIHEAEKYQQLVENYKRLENLTADQAMERVREKLHVSTSTIYERLRLLRLPEAARAAALSGRLPASHAGLIAKLDDAEAQKAVTARILMPEDHELPDEDDAPDTTETLISRTTVMSFRDTRRLIAEKQRELERRREYELQKVEFEKKGLYVLTDKENQFANRWDHAPKGYVHADESTSANGYNSWKKAMGRHAPAPALALRPSGEASIVFRESEAIAAVKKNRPKGKTSSSSRPAAEVQREREHKERTERFLQLLGPVAAAAEENDSPDLWRFLFRDICLSGGRADSIWRVVKRRFPDAKKGQVSEFLTEYAKTATGKQLRGIVVETMFASHAPSNWAGEWDETFPTDCEYFGVKAPAWKGGAK